MMRHNKQGTTGRVRACGSVAVAAAAVALAVLPAGAASAESPAVVGPLLQIFTFGADVGVPTGCQAASAALGSGSVELGLASQAAPVVSAINDGCTALQTQADSFIAQATVATAALAAWNPYVNPVIAQSADSITQLGTENGDSLAPFGPTIAGLGGTLNFFQGH